MGKRANKPEEEENIQEKKKFKKEDKERLVLFYKANRKNFESNQDCFKKFAAENGYTWTQVKQNYAKIIKEDLNFASKDLKDSQPYLDETKILNKKRKKNEESSDDHSDYFALEESSSSDSYEDSLFRPKIHITKTIEHKEDLLLLAFHHFESTKSHVFALRYPTHLQFEYSGYSTKTKELLLDVKDLAESNLNSTSLQAIFKANCIDIGDLEETKATNSTSSTSVSYTLKQKLPKDADPMTIKHGEAYTPDDARIFLIYCNKKVDIFKPSPTSRVLFAKPATMR